MTERFQPQKNTNELPRQNSSEKEYVKRGLNDNTRNSGDSNLEKENESNGATPIEQRTPKHLSRQTSEESKTKRRALLHPAERRALIVASSNENFHKVPKSFNAFRRLSRADFTSIRKAGRKVQILSFKDIIHRFEKHSTIHGICHASSAPSSFWRKFWFCVFVICFCILVVQVIYHVHRYFLRPKNVNLDLKFENAPFPSVTVCNLNPYKASSLGNDEAAKATIDAFKNILDDTGRSEGIAAALKNSGSSKIKRQIFGNNKNRNAASKLERRYLQVFAQCYCEINRISAERKRGSCFAAYKGRVSVQFDESRQLHNFHPTKCLCQLDWITKTLWPCFPYNTWKEHICVECVELTGHCPMRFYEYSVWNNDNKKHKLEKWEDKSRMKNCLCHREYNHCIAENENGEVPEIIPSVDLEQLNFIENFVISGNVSMANKTSLISTTITPPEIFHAMGFEELKDEIAIKTQARENLMFVVEEKPLTEKIKLSQPKDELILKCSFNQHDCNIERDFKILYDPTYGNCYTFNWDRSQTVTAHRAGANYGLRVMLYANVSEYLPTSEAVGFRITVHDKWTVPFADAFGYNAPTGFMSSFGVRMKKFKRLEPPYGHCSEGGDVAETYIYKGYSYSIEGCHRSCTQHEVIRVCGCADPMFPVPVKSHSCKVSDPIARDCIKNTSRYLGIAIAQGILAGCHCHQPCDEIGYEVTYSAARWPSGTTKLMECESNDDLCMEKYRKNAAMIQVFYEELNYETLSEIVGYTMASLFADLGGVMGLWIGISVVSILEVVQLIWFCFESLRKKRQIERKASSSSNQYHSIQQNAFTRSLTSLSSVANKKQKTPSNTSIGGKSKKSSQSSAPSFAGEESVREPVKIIVEEEENHSTNSAASSPKRNRSLGPDDELPCTCLYSPIGKLVFMRPLCPFHGYMVRRVSETGYDGTDQDPPDEATEDDEGPHTNSVNANNTPNIS